MRLGFVLVAAMAAGPARAELGPCDKLLEHAVRSYVGEAARKDFPRMAYPSICAAFESASKDRTRDAERKSWGLVGGEGEYDRAKFDGLKTGYCTLGKSLLSNVPLYRTAAGALEPRSMKAWKRCVDAADGKYGPPLDVEQIDEYALSFTLRPAASDVRGGRVTVQGFEKCRAFSARFEPKGRKARFEVPALAKGKEHDLVCFRKVAKKPPCGTELAMPASLTLELEDARGVRIQHRFRMARVMSRECPPPASR
jgi:hypothetical protein